MGYLDTTSRNGPGKLTSMTPISTIWLQALSSGVCAPAARFVA
jgi:hypothetical protein